MNKIPPVDLTRQHQLISEEATEAVLKILSSGRYIGGEAITTFESQFAQYLGVNECVGCNSGTDALYMALRALNIGAGDEVITTSFTFIATSEVIVRVGAKPVFVDIDNTFNFNLNLVRQAITKKTKAIIAVHLFGQPVDMTGLMKIAREYNLKVIEDCAQATGAEWQQQKVGSIGDVGCFSFFPTKNLGACGDAGALTTNDGAISRQVKVLREHGCHTRYLHEVTGINSRLDALQAAILSIKLRYLDNWNQQRITAAAYYQKLLQPVTEIKLPSALPEGKNVWNQYTICVAVRGEDSRRDRLRELLQNKGVTAMVYYPLPLHLQPVYQNLGYKEGQLSVSERAAREVLSLPLFPGITPEEQQQVAYSLKDCLLEIGSRL
ncbi:DegT/DnrJ/EryC1/StrS aminotransferase family protein [Myxosarcina sp. GI1]|uniref:DegT/DnrJ/EryC1/StrS family aminotransferase n=1 Tax=Myxosarcina sp. GI1 TaxID=1541065 RepID=UPI00056D00A7|nr:DegT/DnrJ/EryC1/StrS family aminotransferase [Myxosarcina sp. GI1]